MRLGPEFRTRQFLLFRDLDEADLWLVADGTGRWAEMNGAERHDLRGTFDLDVSVSPFPIGIPMTALDLDVGDSAQVKIAVVDVETLGIAVVERTYVRLGERRWQVDSVEIEVLEDGLIGDHPERFRRSPTL